ncbi:MULTISPECIES: FecCD family ABC transporter permease [Paenibacillus]|jgi:iron complex transport system permease protein|uniref:Iron ABC transporter permease n=2 Tax=Paenibacillus TaxID=44249 RepID=A0A089LE63_PAEBO|nr:MULTISPECIES: iron ABC transporter permease [Paenibacillus]AIQ29629.1 iron ABC transporter permease [Paenibacillus sp. FSL P4-0081]AIQ58370.1 iron ABC transporter permease [Paenibacillus borealis]NOU81875.1 iron chelate uptake ABC transporter family permease subunit [Paenibacillus phytohabitans]
MKPARLYRNQPLVVSLLMLLILATIVIGIGIGSSPVSYGRLIPTILGHGSFEDNFVLFSIRLPRILITLLAGMALALSGAILQGITRNELADPGIIGINAGAGVGVTVFFIFASIDAGSFIYMIPLAAFAGALVTAVLIYAFSYTRTDGVQPIRLVITGVGFSMALSGVMIVLISSVDRTKVDFISKWLAGNVWGTDWPFVLALLPWLIILVPYVLYKSRTLNLLALNEPTAIGAGVAVSRDRVLLMLAAVALAASAVSMTGGIAFVGLMAPHIARALVGARHQQFVPVSILIGGWLLLLADTIGRNLTQPDGIAAGIMVAFIGAPYFLYLLLKKEG